MRYVESLNHALKALLLHHPDVHLLGEDIADPYGGAFKVTKGLSDAFPGRVHTTPISEAAICGVALGMSMRGLRPVLEIMFGDFITLCCDQLVNGASKFGWMYNGKTRAPMVLRTPMGGRRGYGPTHSQTLETLFLNVPGLIIVAPSHCHDPGRLLTHAVLHEDAPVLFIENKSLYPKDIFPADTNARLDSFHGRMLPAGNAAYPTASYSLAPDETPDAVLVAYGGMAPLALNAALEVFLRDELLVEVVIPSLVKPLDLRPLEQAAARAGRVLVAEESPCAWGWGAEVAAQLQQSCARSLKAPVARVGAKELPIASSRRLEEKILPQHTDLTEALNTLIREWP